MARSLTEPQQRLEDLHLRSVDAVARNSRQQGLAIVGAQLVVMSALRRLELALQRLFGAPRQLGRDLLLRPAKDEWAQRAREPFEIFVSPHAGGAGVLKRFRRSEEAWVQKLEQAPELAQMILDGCAAQRESM